jgi:hypothetical protein
MLSRAKVGGFSCGRVFVDLLTWMLQGLSFTLRLFYDVLDENVTDVTSPEQLCKSVHYIPLELDKETPEFVKQLDYLNVPFTFKRYQLPLFMTQLYDKMEGDSGIKDESVEEDE